MTGVGQSGQRDGGTTGIETGLGIWTGGPSDDAMTTTVKGDLDTKTVEGDESIPATGMADVETGMALANDDLATLTVRASPRTVNQRNLLLLPHQGHPKL